MTAAATAARVLVVWSIACGGLFSAPSLSAPSLSAPSLYAPSLYAPSLYAPSLYAQGPLFPIPSDEFGSVEISCENAAGNLPYSVWFRSPVPMGGAVGLHLGVVLSLPGPGFADQPVEVRLWSDCDGGQPGEIAELTPLASTTIAIPPAANEWIFVPFPALGSAICSYSPLVELRVPDGTADGHVLRVGTNDSSDTLHSFFSSSGCGIAQPMPIAAPIGTRRNALIALEPDPGPTSTCPPIVAAPDDFFGEPGARRFRTTGLSLLTEPRVVVPPGGYGAVAIDVPPGLAPPFGIRFPIRAEGAEPERWIVDVIHPFPVLTVIEEGEQGFFPPAPESTGVLDVDYDRRGGGRTSVPGWSRARSSILADSDLSLLESTDPSGQYSIRLHNPTESPVLWIEGGIEFSLPTPIPDGDLAGVSIPIFVDPAEHAFDVDRIRVFVSIDHPNPLDLRLTLESPSGTSLVVFDHFGALGPAAFRITDTCPFTFEYGTGLDLPGSTSFEFFDGEVGEGEWTLHVVDDVGGGEAGAITDWSLEVVPKPCEPPGLPAVEVDCATGTATIAWENPIPYTSIEVRRDGVPIATGLPGDTTTFADVDWTPGRHGYGIVGVLSGARELSFADTRFACLLFLRGDADGDGSVVAIPDASALLAHLFQGGAPPPCARAGDANADDLLDLGDPIFLLTWGFLGGPPPPAPGPDSCGLAPGDPPLTCETPLSVGCP